MPAVELTLEVCAGQAAALPCTYCIGIRDEVLRMCAHEASLNKGQADASIIALAPVPAASPSLSTPLTYRSLSGTINLLMSLILRPIFPSARILQQLQMAVFALILFDPFCQQVGDFCPY
jgi:hypothetical protein